MKKKFKLYCGLLIAAIIVTFCIAWAQGLLRVSDNPRKHETREKESQRGGDEGGGFSQKSRGHAE